MSRKIILKYGELWLKSKHIRNNFAKKLMRNTKSMLRMNGIDFELSRERDRMLITTEQVDEAVEVLKRVFGFSQIIVSEEVFNDIDEIREKVLEIAEGIGEDETFMIRARRKNKKYPMTSREIEVLLAEKIERRVDLKNPDVRINVVIRGQTADIYTERIKGAGGLPIGTSGRMLCLLSSGIDSPVAAWMIMKRGTIVDFITFFDTKKSESVRNILSELKKWSPRGMRLFEVEYGKTQETIQRWAKKYTCVFCKRFMYRIAQRIAMDNNYDALITGENLSQVASQTIYNLRTQQRDLEIPVMRPLLAFDKTEIIEIASKIGTFNKSEKGENTCRFVPDSPATKSDDSDIFHIEKMMNVEKIIADAAESAEVDLV